MTNPLKVMVVDDTITYRMIMKMVAGSIPGVSVTGTASNGKQAIDSIESQITANAVTIPEVLLLDVEMPVMDGHEALKQIRALEEKKGIFVGDGVKIVMVTALGDKKNILEAFHEGCEYYLVKPFQQKKILELLNEMDLLKLEE